VSCFWRVACEFIAASRKLSAQGFGATDAWNRLADFLALFRPILPTAGVLERAQRMQTNHGVSFWDALILAACAEAGGEILYSQDVPGIPTPGGVKVVNPFHKGPPDFRPTLASAKNAADESHPALTLKR
jgi:predicted nucleic acid-binding protein